MERQYRTTLSAEEKANVLTHGLAGLMALVLSPFLIWKASADALYLAGALVFCLSLLAVYGTSTAYHAAGSERWRFVLRKADHISIYFLIAGTHTPFLLLFLNNSTGLLYLGILWGLVGFGIFYKLFFFGRWEWFSVALYLGMGWMAVFTIPPMLEKMPSASLNWIIIGGISYTLGVVFYAWHRIPYHHAIWHIMVMGGSGGHFMAVWIAL